MTSFANQNTRSNSNNNSSPRNQQHKNLSEMFQTLTPTADRLEPRGAAVLPPGGLQSNFTPGVTRPVKNHFKVSTFCTFQVDNLIVVVVVVVVVDYQ